MESDLLQFLQSQRQLAAQLWEELQFKLLLEMCEAIVHKVPAKYANAADVLKLRFYCALSLASMRDTEASWRALDQLYESQAASLGPHHEDTLATLQAMISILAD